MSDLAATRSGIAVPPGSRYPKAARLLYQREFARVFDTGKRVAAPAMAVHWMPAAAPRLGIAVSRKVDPNAVGRNRIKRVLRDAFRRCRAQLQPADYVVVVRAPAAALDNARLREAFMDTLRRARALPPPAPAGTMRPACAPASPPPSMPDPRSG